MNAKNLLMAGLISAMFLICGCGKQPADEKRVTITYGTFERLPEQRKLLSELISEFEKEYPDIKVKIEEIVDPTKIITEVAGGNAPDAFYWLAEYFRHFVEKGALLDLYPYVKRDGIDLSGYFEKIVDSCKYGDGLYAFPIHFSTIVLYYNKNIFNKEGIAYPDESWNMRTFLESAGKMTKTDTQGRFEQFGALRPSPNDWVLLVALNGAKPFNEDLSKCLFDDARVLEAIEFWRDIQSKHHAVPSAAQLAGRAGTDQVSIPSLFMSGRLAMVMGGTFMAVEFSNIKDFEWDIAPVPRSLDGKSRQTNFFPGYNCIWSGSKHKKEAWEFVKFYSSRKGLNILAQYKNCVPALKSAAESPPFSNPPPENIGAYTEALDYAIEIPRITRFGEFSGKIVVPEIEKVFLEQQTPEEACKNISIRYEEYKPMP